MFRALCFGLAFAAVTIGCHGGEPREPRADGRAREKLAEVAKSIVLCKTTEAELRASLGATFRDGIVGKTRVVTWLSNADDVARWLGVAVDDHGVVVDLYWDAPTETPWNVTNRCAG